MKCKFTTVVPGMKAQHAIITEVCRLSRGHDGAFDEAVARLREEYDSLFREGVPNPMEVHLVLSVVRHGWMVPEKED